MTAHNCHYHTIRNFQTCSGFHYKNLVLSYEIFGQPIRAGKPVVLVCHALTGNSTVAGEHGWWNQLIGFDRLVSLHDYTVVGINIPGNGYAGEAPLGFDHFKHLTVRDIAALFVQTLKALGVKQLHVSIGGSLGGAISWEIAVSFPDFVKCIVPIATDWKASDWVLAFNKVQQQILRHSTQPVHDARMMAMMFYRTPESFQLRFNRSWNDELDMPNIESWLLHHGKKLEGRFGLDAYLLMNHYLSSHDISRGHGSFAEATAQLKARVVMVSIDSDLFFQPASNRETAQVLQQHGLNAVYREITSIHGHDGFLIEYDQLNKLLEDVFAQGSEYEQLKGHASIQVLSNLT